MTKTFVYGDLYRYDVEKQEWKWVSSPNSPPPRSSHQAVVWKNYLYVFGRWRVHRLHFLDIIVLSYLVPRRLMTLSVFLRIGGEFTSPNQERFHHYKVILSSPAKIFSHPSKYLGMETWCGFLCRISGCWI